MSTLYLFFKAFHIIGFVSWFAGLFYLVRIFVYYAEANEQPPEMQENWKKQMVLMQERAYAIITTPAMIITWFFGIGMLLINPAWLYQSWIHIKLLLLALMVTYHFYCGGIIKKNKENKNEISAYQFRLLNELPTLFLLAIVLLAVLKNITNFIYLFLGILVFGILLYIAVKQYRKHRLSTKNESSI